ncbi:MAG: 23S rRNA (guanosine(2251)-2'-O)-methyltransferase RlmB [Clostridia bacterium]|nr:23S rRNA (guanosine(2251)-2'-O)-methyltransferase RlmB [Clostridia bacterium]
MKFEGKNAVKELLATNGKIEKIMLADGTSDADIRAIFKQAKSLGIQVQWVPKAALEKASETGHHQGVIAIGAEYEYAELEDVISKCKNAGKEMFFIILDEILDPHNLGSIIRTAECAGLTGVIIPARRSAMVNETVVRTSAGATAYIPIIKVQNVNSAIETLKKSNVWVYALDMAGEPMGKTNLTGNLALVVGNEGDGVHSLTRKTCDGVISIPMFGNLNSLNASVSAGIAIYEAVRQRSK